MKKKRFLQIITTLALTIALGEISLRFLIHQRNLPSTYYALRVDKTPKQFTVRNLAAC